MAHPMKAEGVRGHNAKLRRMTRHYGAANPSMHKEARVNYPKHDGPEEAVEYGADSAGATARADRPARRAAPGNEVATYHKGGRVAKAEKVRKRADGGLIPQKRSGKRGKGKTNISINIAPAPHPLGVSGPPMGLPPAVAPAIPPRPPVPMPPPGGAGLPPGGMPPGVGAGAMGPLGALALQQKAGGMMPRKRGGRVHSDEAQDEHLIKRMVKGSALKHRAKGGKVGLTAGRGSGEGRLEANRSMDHKLRPVRGVAG